MTREFKGGAGIPRVPPMRRKQVITAKYLNTSGRAINKLAEAYAGPQGKKTDFTRSDDTSLTPGGITLRETARTTSDVVFTGVSSVTVRRIETIHFEDQDGQVYQFIMSN